MHIADNIIRHHLRNMYFLAGTACGGKTTMSRALAENHVDRYGDAGAH